MDRAVYESVTGSNKNYVLPFLEISGEEENCLKENIESLYACGIREFCVVPGGNIPCGQEILFRNIECVLEEAARRDMRIWIRDDLTAAGCRSGEESCREELCVRMADVSGPLARGVMDAAAVTGTAGKLVSVVAMKMADGNSVAPEAAVDGSSNRIVLTDEVKDGRLVCSFPEGVWRVFTVYSARSEGGTGRTDCLCEASVGNLIRDVHEVLYKRFGDYFGGVIAGFLSEAPDFGTSEDAFSVPWTEALNERMETLLGERWKDQLPLLWVPCVEERAAAKVRYAYMDAVSELYQLNYPERLGAWCRDHGVDYIGIIPEDRNGHSRPGAGPGHFFRAASGMPVAGISHSGREIIPGNPNTMRLESGFADGQYYHYAQIKLAASASLLQPEKKGRLLYVMPWGEGGECGVRDMKWIADYLIANGVNRLAFRGFPGRQGSSFRTGTAPAEFPYFVRFMRYCSRLCHIFSGGRWVPEVGVLYHGELEWMDDCMTDQVPARKLKEGYIDYAFIPSDALSDADGTGSGRYPVRAENGRLYVHDVPLKVLIVPRALYADPKLLRFMETCPDIRVVFVDAAPKGVDNAVVVPLDELVPKLREMGVIGARSDVRGPASFFHYVKDSGDLWMVFNESKTEAISGTLLVRLKNGEQKVWKYDVRKNCVYPVEQLMAFGFDEPRMLSTLHLEPYESAVFFTATEEETRGLTRETDPDELRVLRRTDLSGGWTVEVSEHGKTEVLQQEAEQLVPVSEQLPGFAGSVRYVRTLMIDDPQNRYMLEAEHFYEAGRVLVNGEEADCRICPRYRFDLSGCLKEGENLIEIEMAGSMAAGCGGQAFGIREPVGMFGQVRLLEVE